MKKNLLSTLTACLLLFAITACAQNRVTGSKNYITQTRSVEAFDGIKLAGSPDVTYTQREGTPSIEIYGSDNILPMIETYVESGKLIIKYKNNTSIQNPGKLEIKVTAPAIKSLSVSGSGKITLANGITTAKGLTVSIAGSGDIDGDKVQCKELSASISGSGNMNFEEIKTTSVEVHVAGSGDVDFGRISAANAKVSIAGSGDISLAGNCTNAEYSISGSGGINGADLEAKNVSTRISGSGSIRCSVTETLKGGVSGSGSVGYKGNPRTIDFSKKGLHKL